MRTLAPTFTGLALVLVLLAGALPGASHPVGFPGTGAEECGGFAPLQTQCHDGPHVWALTMEHTVFAADDYTGVITSTLDPVPQIEPIERVAPNIELRCAFEDGQSLGCVETGADDANAMDGFRRVVVRSCRSLELPVSKDPAQAETRGGEGGWLCQVKHR